MFLQNKQIQVSAPEEATDAPIAVVRGEPSGF
jgi:hypothetical protein